MSVLLIPLALALDAFGVSLSLGFSNKYKFRQLMIFCMSFSIFQFLFSFFGGILGDFVNSYILNVPKIFGGIIILVVGLMMLKESFSHEDEINNEISKNLYLTLGISVSVDALVIGFTAYNFYDFKLILLNTILVGLVTLILCISAVLLSMILKKVTFISKYADFLGGIILIIFGLKMICS